MGATAGRRVAAAVGLAGAAVLAVVGCRPADGSMDAVTVALTTDQRGTAALERKGIDVQWLSCTSSFGEGGKTTATATGGKAPSPSVRSVATVDCEGETKDGEPITLTGEVTEELGGACVRGDLTAKVDGKTVLEAKVLGNCSRATRPVTTPPRNPGTTAGPGAPARPTVTVTVTVTVTESFQGK